MMEGRLLAALAPHRALRTEEVDRRLAEAAPHAEEVLAEVVLALVPA